MRAFDPRVLGGTLVAVALSVLPPQAAVAQQLASQTAEPAPPPPTPRSAELSEDIDKALSLYRRNLDASDVESLLERWETEGGPRGDEDLFVVAVLWRRAGRTDRALAALSDIDPDGPLAALAALEEARTLFSFGVPDALGDARPGEDTDASGGALNDVFGSQAFWSACRAMDPRVKAELWLDLRGLATPLETDEWSHLPGTPTTCGWVRAFLAERAIGMAVSVDERLAIHYRRLYHVRDWYYLRQPRFTRDMTDRLGRPDSLEFDDRGLVLLRMGPPDRQAGELNLAVQSNVSWAYYDRAGPRVYHFAPVSRVFAGVQPLEDYRMLENLAYATGLTMTQELLRAGGASFSRLYMSRAGLDLGFAQLAFNYAMMSGALNGAGIRAPGSFMRVLAEERERTRDDAEAVIQRVPDVPQVVPVVAYAQELLRFWDPDRSRIQVWALISARAGDLTRAVHPDGRIQYGVRAAFGAVADGVYYLERAETRASAKEVASDDGIPLRVALELPPGRHSYTVLVQDQLEPQAGNWQRDTIVVPELPEGIPAVSDIAVATDSGGSWTRDGETFLRVSPTHVVGPDGGVIVYFEVYNVEPGQRYQVETRVVPASVRQRIFSGKVADVAFTLRYRSEMPASKIGRELLRIDLTDTEPGAYLLGVRVRDVETGIVSLPAITPLTR